MFTSSRRTHYGFSDEPDDIPLQTIARAMTESTKSTSLSRDAAGSSAGEARRRSSWTFPQTRENRGEVRFLERTQYSPEPVENKVDTIHVRNVIQNSVTPMYKRLSRVLHAVSARVVDLSDRFSSDKLTGSIALVSPSITSESSPAKAYFTTSKHLKPENKLVLQGATFGLFQPENPLRRLLYALLLHPFTEILLLLLIVFQAVILTVDSSYDVFANPDRLLWGNWTDWALLAVFVCYTVEIPARAIVSGFIRNPGGEQSAGSAFAINDAEVQHSNTSIFGRFSTSNLTFGTRQSRKQQLLGRAYLRRSFNRIDFIAVIAYWLYLITYMTGLVSKHHVYIFKAVSCMRVLRLLNVTRGTSTILRSLKKAAPLLVNVALFVGFFWLFMSVIGVQSFNGSFRRQCVWVDPLGVQANVTQDLQFCGGQWSEGVITPFLLSNGQPNSGSPKGYICPEQSFCVEVGNPYNGTVHFDNIFNSMELVFVIMSSNTFADLMYYTMDSDYFEAAFFFIAGILILTFWLMSLVIAVVTTSFQVIREEQHSSAFAAKAQSVTPEVFQLAPRSKYIRYWEKTSSFWICLVIADLGVQAAKRSSMPVAVWSKFELAESFFTLVFAMELIARALCYFPYWRGFATKLNFMDLFLVIVTSIIQLPMIKSSGSLYRWLTIFQVMRSYRVILAIPLTRELILKILGTSSGLLNLMFFLLCVVYTAALVACQLIRGDFPLQVYGESQEITFKNIYNSFVGMYQVLSSENWTTVLYGIQSSQTHYYQAWIGAIFFIVWFVFGQNILMSMFIAVLQENFEISEDEKRKEQLRSFVHNALPSPDASQQSDLAVLSLLKRQQHGFNHHTTSDSRSGPDALHQSDLRAFLEHVPASFAASRARSMKEHLQIPFLSFRDWIKSLLGQSSMQNRVHNPFTSHLALPHIATPQNVVPTSQIIDEFAKAHGDRLAQQTAYLRSFPTYDKVLWSTLR